jgi:hypothetical protein
MWNMKTLKPRFESKELKLYRRLHVRGNLEGGDVNYLFYLEKGYEGEKMFDQFTSNLSDSWLFLNDLLFEVNKSESQIDSIGLTGDTIHIFEIKNLEGDYYIEDGRWYKSPKIDIKNPYEQLKRSESMLRKLLQEHGFNLKIEIHLIFVNPEFYLYHTPMNLPIIFPNQIKRFMNHLNNQKFNLNANHLKLAEKLLSVHMTESKYTQFPKYHFDQLKKGITCLMCNTFITEIKIGKVVCHKCGCEEGISEAIIRSTEELKFLFPERKITTNAVYEWCKIYKSKKGIWKTLRDNYKMQGHGKYSYFV